ncbi:MAG: hypothetical protein PVI86_05220 [Phycisphaerae bacterium]
MTTTEIREVGLEPDAPQPDLARPCSADEPIACVEVDRYCQGCGYNLRTLPIHRDVRTQIPMVRCTECGRYESANEGSAVTRPWVNRLMSIVLGVWILTIVASIFWLGFGEAALCYVTLDELTVHGGYTTQRVGGQTIRTWSSYGALEVRPESETDRAFLVFILGMSCVTAFFVGSFLTVVCPHWPRWVAAIVVALMPVIGCGIVAVVWSYEAPHLVRWGLPHIGWHAGLQLFGGLAGVVVGRAAARLGVTIFLPPSVRPRLAYLWFADRKPPPHTRGPVPSY